MSKKILVVLLSLSLIGSTVGMPIFADEAEAEKAEVASIVGTDLSDDELILPTGENLSIMTEQDDIVVSDLATINSEQAEHIIYEKEPDNVNNDRIEKNIDIREILSNEPVIFNPDRTLANDYTIQNEDNIRLMATNQYTISGTVTLPSGVTTSEDKTIAVYVYKPFLSGNVITSEYASTVANTSVTLKAGKTSVNYSVSVEAGEYIVCARVLEGATNIQSCNTYYSTKGSCRSKYAAEVIKVTSNISKKNITLLKAERNISGTITLSNSATSDYYLYVDVENGNDYGYNSDYYVNIPIKSGDKKITYTLGVDKGSYSLYVSGNSNSGYFDGAVIGDYSNRLYLDTSDKSYDNINMIFNNVSSTSKQRIALDVTLQFKEAAKENKAYNVVLYDNTGEWIDCERVELNMGESSCKRTVYYNSNKYEEVYVGFTDVTGTTGTYTGTTNKYFYSKENGIVGSLDKATLVKNSVTSLTITEPSYYTISGNYFISASKINKYAYVCANFDNGEVFYSRITILKNSTNGTYTVKIPQRLKGLKFNIVYGMADDADGIEEEYDYETAQTLNGNISNIDIELANSGTDILEANGKIVLPEAAPTNGLVVSVHSAYNSRNEKLYYVPAGKKEIEYEYEVSANSSDEFGIRATIQYDCPINIANFKEIYFTTEENSDEDININFDKTVAISGKVSLPANISISNYVSFAVSANGRERFFTISPSATYTNYTVYANENDTLSSLRVQSICDPSAKLLDEDIYYTEDGGSLDYSDIEIPLDMTINNMNFTLMECITISGTVNIPSDAYYDSLWLYVTAENCDTGDEYDTEIRLSQNNKSYTIRIPKEQTGDYYVNYRCSGGDSTNIVTDTNFYYSAGGTVMDFESAERIAVKNNTKNINFELNTGYILSGVISLPNDGYLKSNSSYKPSLNIYAKNIETGTNFNNYIRWSGKNAKYRIVIPKELAGQYNIYYYIDKSNEYDTNLALGTNVYYTSEGMIFDSESAEAIKIDKDCAIDITLAKGIMISGKISIPNNAYVNNGDAYVYIYAQNSDKWDTFSKSYKINNTTGNEINYTISISPNDVGNYKIYYRVSTSNGIVTNLVNTTDYYYTPNGVVLNTEETVNISGDTDNINIPLQIGNVVSGNIKMPEGGYTNDKLSVYISTYRTANSTSYESYGISVSGFDGKDIPYSLCLPKEFEEEYYLSYYAYTNGRDTNLLNTNMYYATDGSKKISSEAKVFTSDTNYEQIDLVLPIGRVISGKLIFPDDVFFNSRSSSFEISIGTGEYFSRYTARLNSDNTYTCTIPDDLTGKQYVRADVDNLSDSNVLTGIWYYYTENDRTAQIDFSDGEAVNGIDINIDTGKYISGKLSLPKGAKGSETYLVGVVDGSYSTDIYMYSNNRDYHFVVPKYMSNIKIYAKAKYNYNNDEDDNLDRETTAYYNSTGTVYTEDEAEVIPLSETKTTNINLTLPITIAKIKITSNKPETYADGLRYTLYAKFGSGKIYEAQKYMYSDEESEETYFAIPNSETSTKFRLYYQLDDDNSNKSFVSDRVYINPDGTYTTKKFNSKRFTLEKSMNIEHTFVTAEQLQNNVETVLESGHPYNEDEETKYSYTHPDEYVDYLLVTFSEDTELAENDYIIISDSQDNKIGLKYKKDELAGQTIKIDDTSFNVEIVSDSQAEGWGFAITDIQGIKVAENNIGVASGIYTQDGEPLSYQNFETTEYINFDISSTLAEDTTAHIIVVAYCDGELVNIDSKDVNITSETDMIEDFPCTFNKKDVDTVKIFAWDSLDGMIPLMQAYGCR